MTPIQLLLRLRSRNVKVWVSAGELRYEAAGEPLDDELRAQLEASAGAIVQYLTAANEYQHTTQYLTVRDGVRLAMDLFRPVRDGRVVSEPLPVIWCHDRYHRAEFADGMLVTKLDIHPWLRGVLRAGYVVAAVDARGTGASEGTRTAEFSEQERQDAYEVTEWLAAQAWSNQRIGMFGESYLAIAQFLTASAAPPHLRAIFPQMAVFDLYSFLYPGGVLREDFVRNWGDLVRRLDCEQAAVPVAGHENETARIVATHLGNEQVLARAIANPFRDSSDEILGTLPYHDHSPSGLLPAIQAAGVPVCQLAGWLDLWVRDALCWYRNLAGPQRLIITADSHNERKEIDLEAEHLRWFDYWLKDMDTGVMDEPPIRYRVMNARPGREWRHAWQWPPPEVTLTPLYFHAGPTGSVGSVNDGLLDTEPPGALELSDEYVVDYTATTGRGSRWAAGYGADFGYPPLTENDSKGLTYTSPPLTSDVEVVGHPVAHLWLMSSHPDGDLFAYLERVEPDGSSYYVTEGTIRASHRALAQPPFDYIGLPYHPGHTGSVEDLPPGPAEVVFDLHPTAQVFRAGSRIRVTVTGCDRDNASTPVHHPAPVLQVLRQGRFTSRLDLPIIGADPFPQPAADLPERR
jgi:hypothetical protein